MRHGHTDRVCRWGGCRFFSCGSRLHRHGSCAELALALAPSRVPGVNESVPAARAAIEALGHRLLGLGIEKQRSIRLCRVAAAAVGRPFPRRGCSLTQFFEPSTCLPAGGLWGGTTKKCGGVFRSVGGVEVQGWCCGSWLLLIFSACVRPGRHDCSCVEVTSQPRVSHARQSTPPPVPRAPPPPPVAPPPPHLHSRTRARPYFCTFAFSLLYRVALYFIIRGKGWGVRGKGQRTRRI